MLRRGRHKRAQPRIDIGELLKRAIRQAALGLRAGDAQSCRRYNKRRARNFGHIRNSGISQNRIQAILAQSKKQLLLRLHYAYRRLREIAAVYSPNRRLLRRQKNIYRFYRIRQAPRPFRLEMQIYRLTFKQLSPTLLSSAFEIHRK